MSLSSVGFAFGSVSLISGTAGAVFGPFVVGVLERKARADAVLIAGLFAVGAAAPPIIWAPIAPNAGLSLAAMSVIMFALSAASAMAPLLPQLIAPNAIRARVTALCFFNANIRLGLTPITVGFINERSLVGVSGNNEAVAVTAAALLPASFAIRLSVAAHS